MKSPLPTPLKPQQIKNMRRIGHTLNPVILVGVAGVSEQVLLEAERALHDHELIKVKFSGEDRLVREAAMQQLAQTLNAAVVQKIGKVLLVYRKNAQPNTKLSNMHRFEHLLK